MTASLMHSRRFVLSSILTCNQHTNNSTVNAAKGKILSGCLNNPVGLPYFVQRAPLTSAEVNTALRLVKMLK